MRQSLRSTPWPQGNLHTDADGYVWVRVDGHWPVEEARHRHPPGRAVALVILGAPSAALPQVLGRALWLGVKGLASLGSLLGAPAVSGAG